MENEFVTINGVQYEVVEEPINKTKCYEKDCIYYDKETHLVSGTVLKHFPMLRMAKSMAARAYENKTRKTTGLPFEDHCTEIYRLCMHYKFSHGDDAMYAAAVLHDYLEDAVQPEKMEETIEWMKKTLGFSVTTIVIELTNDIKNQDGKYPKQNDNGDIEWVDKTEYVNYKLSTMGSKALFIKLLDMMSNLGESETLPDFVKRIHGHISYIENNIETVFKDRFTADHLNILQSIRRILKDIYRM